MKLRTIIYLLSCLLWTACSDDELQPTTADEATTVPITLTLGQRTTRSAPPGSTDPMHPTIDGEAETEQTNTVRIIAFRCKETQEDVSYYNSDDDYADSDFVYDPTNDQTVTCSRATTSDHRLTAHGKLKKMKGYAYRVVALAYSLTRSLPFSNQLLADVGEENLFTLNLAAHTTLDQFEADLTHVAHDSWKEFRNGASIVTHNTHSLSGQLCYAPQLFYGQCTSVEGNKVIHFHEKNAADSISSTYPLSGVLYRGMAKVQLTLKIDKLYESGTLQWIGLLANETRTSVKLSTYDDFLQPFNPIHTTIKKNGTYTLVGFVNTGLSVGSTVTLTAWLLPTATKLAIRTFIRGSLVRSDDIRNSPIEVSELSSAETGTGIISPDVVDNTFYLRRNQRYQFTGNLSTLTSKTELE